MGAFNRRWLCPLCAPSGHSELVSGDLKRGLSPLKIAQCHRKSSIWMLDPLECLTQVRRCFVPLSSCGTATSLRWLRRREAQAPRTALACCSSPRPAGVDEVVVAPDGTWRPRKRLGAWLVPGPWAWCRCPQSQAKSWRWSWKVPRRR